METKLTREYAEKLANEYGKKAWGEWSDEVAAGGFGCEMTLSEISSKDYYEGYMKAIEETNAKGLLEALGREKKSYQLMCTYLKNKYFISTIYRESAMIHDCWYFETMVWEWDDKTKQRGEILEQEDSGMSEDAAINNHLLIIKKLNNQNHETI